MLSSMYKLGITGTYLGTILTYKIVDVRGLFWNFNGRESDIVSI